MEKFKVQGSISNLGNQSLKDLVLSGVKWELSETAVPFQQSSKFRVQSSDNKDKNINNKTVANGDASSEICTLNSELPTKSPCDFVVPPIAVTDAGAILQSANDAANGAGDAESLCAALREFDHPLAAFANAVMPHIGKRESPFAKAMGDKKEKGKLIIITDMPSGDDDAAGKIMCGAAGELLDRMLSSIGISRESVCIVPLVFWRTPGGRTPTREEMDLCRPFIAQAILIACESAECRVQSSDNNHKVVILTLGTLAAAEIAGAKLPVDHGKISELCTLNSALSTKSLCDFVVPIWHPNYLMLKPDAKKDVWAALQKVREFLI